MLNRGAHERVDQLVEFNLAGYRLGYLDDVGQIELLDRRQHCADRIGRLLPFRELRVELLELPGLRNSSPAQITRLRVSQVDVSDFRKTAFRVKPRSEFVGERFVVYEPVRVG